MPVAWPVSVAGTGCSRCHSAYGGERAVIRGEISGTAAGGGWSGALERGGYIISSVMATAVAMV